MSNYLFIGSFLSKTKGSLDITESIINHLKGNNLQIKYVSHIENKIVRLIHIVFTLIFSKFNIVHISVYSDNAFIIAEFATYISKLRRKKILLTLHGGRLNDFFIENPKRVKKVLNRATKILTPSMFLKESFNDFYKTDYLPNPINLEKFPFKRDEIIENSILWVRAFTNIYNPDLAVKILYEIRKNNPLATLTMIGPDKGTLNATIKLIQTLGLKDSIKIVGPVKNELLFKHYQTHEVYLNTTSYESFGVALVEAASCGIPIVSTSVGEIPYLWQHEENMLLVNSFNESDFAYEIEKLFLDKELSSKLSKNARQKAESFDWKKIEPYWLELLKA